MKSTMWIATGLLAASAVAAVVAARAPVPGDRAGEVKSEQAKARPDATLIRPEVSIDTSGGKVKIRGAFKVARPVSSGKDHEVVVRLTITGPDGKDVRPPEDLSKIDYRRDHPRDVAYPVNKELKFDAGGLNVKVAVVNLVDDGVYPVGHEFAKVVTHGTVAQPAPVSREGR